MKSFYKVSEVDYSSICNDVWNMVYDRRKQVQLKMKEDNLNKETKDQLSTELDKLTKLNNFFLQNNYKNDTSPKACLQQLIGNQESFDKLNNKLIEDMSKFSAKNETEEIFNFVDEETCKFLDVVHEFGKSFGNLILGKINIDLPKYKEPKLRTVKVGEFVNIPEKICKLLNISNGNNLQVVGKVAAFPCYVFYYFATPEGRSIKEFAKTDIEQDIAQNLLPSLKTDTKVVEYNFLSGIVDEHHDDFEKESAWLYRAED